MTMCHLVPRREGIYRTRWLRYSGSARFHLSFPWHWTHPLPSYGATASINDLTHAAQPGVCVLVSTVARPAPPHLTVTGGLGARRLMESTQRGGKGGKVSFGVAVFMVPDAIEYMYFHKLQCAYGFGPRVCDVWTNKRKVWPISDGDYAWWDGVSAGRVTEAPWIVNLTRADNNATRGGAVANDSGRARKLASSHGGGAVSADPGVATDETTTPRVVHVGHSRGARQPRHVERDRGMAEQTEGARDRGGRGRRLKQGKKKKKKGKDQVILPPLRPLKHPGGTADSRARQVRDLFADVSDQQVSAVCVCGSRRAVDVGCDLASLYGCHPLPLCRSGVGHACTESGSQPEPPRDQVALWRSRDHRPCECRRVPPRIPRVRYRTLGLRLGCSGSKAVL